MILYDYRIQDEARYFHFTELISTGKSIRLVYLDLNWFNIKDEQEPYVQRLAKRGILCVPSMSCVSRVNHAGSVWARGADCASAS